MTGRIETTMNTLNALSGSQSYFTSIGEDMAKFRVPLTGMELALGMVAGILSCTLSTLLAKTFIRLLSIESPSVLTLIVLGTFATLAAPLAWLATWYRPADLEARLAAVGTPSTEGIPLAD